MKRTTTRQNHTPTVAEIKAQLAAEGEFLRPLVEVVVQQVLEAEMSEALGAGKGKGPRVGWAIAAAITCAA
jgi:transposase-like protein